MDDESPPEPIGPPPTKPIPPPPLEPEPIDSKVLKQITDRLAAQKAESQRNLRPTRFTGSETDTTGPQRGVTYSDAEKRNLDKPGTRWEKTQGGWRLIS